MVKSMFLPKISYIKIARKVVIEIAKVATENIRVDFCGGNSKY